MRKNFKLTKWSKLPVLHFSSAVMRPLVTIDETGALSCYHIRLARGERMKPAYHKKASEVIWILKGSGEALLGKRRVKLSAGDVLFIPPPLPHGFTADRGSAMTMLAVLSPRVDSQTDFYCVDEEAHAAPRVLAGRWKEGRDGRH